MHIPCLNAWLGLGRGVCEIDGRPSPEQEVRMEHSIEYDALDLQVCTTKGHQIQRERRQVDTPSKTVSNYYNKSNIHYDTCRHTCTCTCIINSLTEVH